MFCIILDIFGLQPPSHPHALALFPWLVFAQPNAINKASVGSVPGGIDVLLAAGFEERATDILELGRQDPGLIWLAKSTLEVCMERLADRGVDV